MHHPGRVAIASLCLSLAACGGGGDGDDAPADPDAEIDDDPPNVAFATPLDGAVEVPADAVVTVFFDEEIDATTVDANSLTVEELGGDELAGEVTAWATGAAFVPSAALRADRTYRVTVSTAITDLAGNELEDTASWSFDTHRRAWGVPVLLEHDNAGDADAYPELVLDGNGDGIAAWTQSDGTRSNVWASRYVAGAGWSAAGLIETQNLGDAEDVELAGNAVDPVIVAVWAQHDGARFNIWSSQFGNAGWTSPVLIESAIGAASVPHVALDTAGNALAVWRQSDGTTFNVYANLYVTGPGWGTPVPIETDLGVVEDPQVAFDGAGDAIAVWRQNGDIWTNRYTAGTGWGTAELLETDETGAAFAPALAIDGADDAIVTWAQQDATLTTSVWANRYEAGVGWSGAMALETEATDAGLPRVAAAASGSAVVTWTQENAAGDASNVVARRYTPAGGWGAIEQLSSGTATGLSAGDAQVAINAAGDAIVAWYQAEPGRFSAWSARSIAGAAFEPAVRLELAQGGAFYPQPALAPSGAGAVVWIQSDGMRLNVLGSTLW